MTTQTKWATASDAIEALIRRVPDYPSDGIVFEDLTPVLADAAAFRLICDELAAAAKRAGAELIAGLDARGFILGSAVAYSLDLGILAVRKKGKLPPPVYSCSYDLEYGSAALEIPASGIDLSGVKVMLIDDVLATGGTLSAAQSVIEQAGASVCGLGVVVEIEQLRGRDRFVSIPLSVIGDGGASESQRKN